MSFVRIARRLLTGRSLTAPARRRPALAATPLDDRITPDVSLVDASVVTNGASNGSSTLLGLSRNGQVAIFSSTGTNFFSDQVDIPNTEDLFTVNLLNGQVQMVTALPGTHTSFSTLLGPGRTFGEATISGDGKFVAFSTKLNAGNLDANYSSKAGGLDLGNSTLDVFRFEVQPTTNNVNVVELVSRTYDYRNAGAKLPSKAVGATADSVSPSISFDGQQVTFVSNVNAATVYPLRDAGTLKGAGFIGNGYANLVVDDGSSDDIFVTNMLGTDTGGFYNGFATQFKTRLLSQYGGNDTLNLFNYTITTQTTNAAGQTVTVVLPFFDQFFRSIGSASGSVGVQVDTQGRYLADDGRTVTFTSGFNTNNLRFGAGNTPLAGNTGRDVFKVAGNPGVLDTAVVVMSSTAGGGTLASTGGTAGVAIMVPTDPTSVVFSAAVGGAQLGAGISAAAGIPELYFRRQDADAKLVSGVSGSFVTPVSGSSLQVLTTGSNAGDVDGFGFSVTPDGGRVAFTTKAKANLIIPGSVALGQSLVSDGGVNNFDVFVKDTTNGKTVAVSVTANGKSTGVASATSPRISADARFVSFESNTVAATYINGLVDKNALPDSFVRDIVRNVTQLGDQVSGANVTGNKGIVPGRTYVASDGDSPPRLVFTSASTNLIPALTLPTGASAIFNLDLQGPNVPPVSDAQQVGAVSAGNGQVAFVTYGAGGSTVIGNRFTPFPGFTGELRLATYQVTVTNADGSSTTYTNMVVGAGPGSVGPRVAIIDGQSAKVVRTFLAFEASFVGGVYVAAGNNADGSSVIALGAGEGGGARLKLLTQNPASTAADPQNDFRTQADFFSFESSFRGGVRPALGDFGSLFPADDPTVVGSPTATPDGVVDLVAAAGESGGPRVSILDGARLRGSIPPAIGFTDPTTVPSAAVRLSDVFVFEQSLRNGAFVSSGDVNGDGIDDLVVGAGPGGGPRVTAYSGKTVITTPVAPTVLANYFALDSGSRNGVRVAVKNIDNDFAADIMAGSGAGEPPQVRTFAAGRLDLSLTPTLLDTFVPFDSLGVLSGAHVG